MVKVEIISLNKRYKETGAKTGVKAGVKTCTKEAAKTGAQAPRNTNFF